MNSILVVKGILPCNSEWIVTGHRCHLYASRMGWVCDTQWGCSIRSVETRTKRLDAELKQDVEILERIDLCAEQFLFLRHINIIKITVAYSHFRHLFYRSLSL